MNQPQPPPGAPVGQTEPPTTYLHAHGVTAELRRACACLVRKTQTNVHRNRFRTDVTNKKSGFGGVGARYAGQSFTSVS